MQPINSIELPTSIDGFTKLIRSNTEILYDNLLNHINDNTDRHSAIDILYQDDGIKTVKDIIDELLDDIDYLRNKIDEVNEDVQEVIGLVNQANELALTKTNTTVNGKTGDVTIVAGVGIEIVETDENGVHTITLTNIKGDHVIISENTGRMYTMTFLFDGIITPATVTMLDLAKVETGTYIEVSHEMNVVDAEGNAGILQTIQPGVQTLVNNTGILRLTASQLNCWIYAPSVVGV